MNRHAWRVQQRVNSAWQAVTSGMQTMYPASTVRPAQPVDAFALDPDAGNDEVSFIIRPVVFNVPEKATHQDSNLYVVMKGWLSFEGPDFINLPLLTKSFGTEVAYFRSKIGALEHVYGAHYDLDEKSAGHPVFHAQVAPQMGMLPHVNERFGRSIDNVDNLMRKVLPNVRTPSAQMDVFAVTLQICADHLIHSGSPPEVLDAFGRMTEACGFFMGAAHRMSHLKVPAASHCYRSTHWYKRDTGEAPGVAA